MRLTAVLVAAAALAASSAHAVAIPGQAAPDFRAFDVNGKTVSLSDFRGKTVVLEWNNPGCPFVQKHYTSGNMQALQQKNTAAGVAWLVVNSTTDAHSDYMTPAKLAAWFTDQKSSPTAVRPS